MAKSPEQIIADWRGDAQALRARGHSHDADLLDQCADEMAGALGGFLAWLSEPDARLKSGRSIDYFRDHFAEWSSLGLAEMRGRTRYFRSVIVPQRAHASAARLAGMRGERAG
jgi:hypothetical protein